uniref:Uncharacterized protein n=1 Tax=Arundo donax TaxID=35708 RepID=A0A0A9APN4_ARUDO
MNSKVIERDKLNSKQKLEGKLTFLLYMVSQKNTFILYTEKAVQTKNS